MSKNPENNNPVFTFDCNKYDVSVLSDYKYEIIKRLK